MEAGGNSPFYNCSNLEKAELEEGITKIPNWIFANSGIVEVTVPESVIEIGARAFSECKKLKNITLPKNLKVLGTCAFVRCTSLTYVYIPKSVEQCGSWAAGGGSFYGCNIKAEFEEGTTKIINSILADSNVTEVIIPESVTEIEARAFSDCENLQSITLPKNLKVLGTCAFVRCTSLTYVYIPKSVEQCGSWTAGGGSFYGCNIKAEFEEGTTKIINSILSNSNVTEVIIPESVTEIEARAFSDCAKLKNITFPKNLKVLGTCAFYGCTSLTYIYIPKSVEKCGSWTAGGGSFYGCNIKAEFEEGTTKIINSILSDSNVTEIILPNSVVEIEFRAFSSCTKLTKINMPKSIQNIGVGAFYECSNLTTVDYKGSEEEWQAISIGNDNTPLSSAVINYNQ